MIIKNDSFGEIKQSEEQQKPVQNDNKLLLQSSLIPKFQIDDSFTSDKDLEELINLPADYAKGSIKEINNAQINYNEKIQKN